MDIPLTSFVRDAREFVKKTREDYKHTDTNLKIHQFIVSKYFDEFSPRSILLFHKMGTGKTILGVQLALKYALTHQIVFILPSTTRKQFLDTIELYRDRMPEEVDAIMEAIDKLFVSREAPNLFDQVERNIKKHLFEVDKPVMFIIDEMHFLCRGVINGSKNAMALYNYITKTPDCKVVLMSGTPIDNSIFELAACFNMLKPRLFMEDYSEFEEFFVKNRGYNMDRMANRLFGLVSFADITSDIQKEFPRDDGIEVIRVPMTENQLINYNIARQKELREKAFSRDFKRPMVKPQGSTSSTYRVMSRVISNGISKWREIWRRASEMRPALIYSQFVSRGGIGDFADFVRKQSESANIAIISGEVPINERNDIIRRFNQWPRRKNSPDILLVSSTGAEGLDLKGIRSIHIMEPYWTYTRIRQIQARGIRFKSHTHLPISERNVKTFVYLSTHPSEQSTDEDIYEKAINQSRLVDEFLTLLKKVSLECIDTDNCYDCKSTDKPLFIDDVYKDLSSANNCIKDVPKSLEWYDKIKIRNLEYYYKLPFGEIQQDITEAYDILRKKGGKIIRIEGIEKDVVVRHLIGNRRKQ